MSKEINQEIAVKFIEALECIKKDRGKMAILRRAVTGQVKNKAAAWPIIISLGGKIEQSEYLSIAILYAIHPDCKIEKNFGEVCRKVAKSKDGSINESSEQRFRRLILSDTSEELCDQLRSWIRMARNNSIRVNYKQLFQNILDWKFNADRIRKEWASEFWGKKQESEESAES